ncbi:MAG: DUF4229 domain-containing protein [Nocardioidaceae bacterium]|nr:DUF4229 domain-containing protein [Nocardioidaceae bacterium]
MKILFVYTLARAAIFAAVFGLLWVILYRQVEWNSVSVLYTALIAMVISAVIAMLALRSLRDKLALEIAERSARTKHAFEARRAAEDSQPD